MQIHHLTPADLVGRLREPGLTVRTGPFVVRLQTALRPVAETVRLLWPDYSIVADDAFTDFHIGLATPRNLRRWLRPQAQVFLDGRSPFLPLPQEQAFPMFEWALNWCIATHAHQFLIIHAAAVERGGYAAILPGAPGSGKSTLCAALANRGWRLLTDEITLICPETNMIVPLVRPVSLKNESIEVIRNFAPQTVFGPEVRDTLKGTVAHMRAPRDAVLRMDDLATPGWVIFPKYRAGSSTEVQPLPKAQTFMWFAGHSYNYTLQGLKGFEVLSGLIDMTHCYSMNYNNLDEAIAWFDNLKTPEIEATAQRVHASRA